jgi:hypothetical protein
MLAIVLTGSISLSANIYVDNTLVKDCTSGNYSIANRACNGSGGNAYNTVQKGLYAMLSGDDLFIRGGIYWEGALELPKNVGKTAMINGTAEDWCTVQSYPGEWAVLDGSTGSLSSRGYVIGPAEYSTTLKGGGTGWINSYWKFERLEIKGGKLGFGIWINGGPFIVRYCYIHDNLDTVGDLDAGFYGGVVGAVWHDSIIEYNYFKNNGTTYTSNDMHSAQIAVYSDYQWNADPRPADVNRCTRKNTYRYNFFEDTENRARTGIYQKGGQFFTPKSGISTEVDGTGWTYKTFGDNIHHNIFKGFEWVIRCEQDFTQIHHNIAYDIKDIGADYLGLLSPAVYAESMTAICSYNNTLIGGRIFGGWADVAKNHLHFWWYNNILDQPVSPSNDVAAFTISNNLAFTPNWNRINIDRNYLYRSPNNYDFKVGSTSGTCKGPMTTSVFNSCDSVTNYKKVSSEGTDNLFVGTTGADSLKTRGSHIVSGAVKIANGGKGGNHPYLAGVTIPSYLGATSPNKDSGLNWNANNPDPDDAGWVNYVLNVVGGLGPGGPAAPKNLRIINTSN